MLNKNYEDLEYLSVMYLYYNEFDENNIELVVLTKMHTQRCKKFEN